MAEILKLNIESHAVAVLEMKDNGKTIKYIYFSFGLKRLSTKKR